MGTWIGGILAAIIATVGAGLILNALSGSPEPISSPGTQAPNPVVSSTEAPPPVVSAAPEPTTTEPAEQLLITSYVWDEDAGWNEHAAWESLTTETSFVPVLSAWNWSPNYPEVTVRFDEFITSDSYDSFNNGPLSVVWMVQATTGVSVDVDDGQLAIRVPEGQSRSNYESRADLFHGVNLGEEFDISVRFTVDEDFYSRTWGGLSLSIVGTQNFQAFVMLQGGSYQSQEIAGSDFRTHAATTADQVEGGLRLKSTIVGR